MQSADVAQFLQKNPDFFEEYADLIADIFVPHPHGGRAIPLAERQILALRERSRVFESKLGELLQFGEENDQIGDKVHQLSLSLLNARDLAAVLGVLEDQLMTHFNVPHVAIRLWSEEPDDTLEAFHAVSDEVKVLAQSLPEPYCGHYVTDEVATFMGEVAPSLRSWAQVALRSDTPFGLLIMSSEDPQRFHPEMGTLYLARIGELASAAIGRFLSR
ncbi:DUF484 family protein [Burkholderiaceae bacterium DAT-1]|nr:DUF484 family protein [Burkholderiaceae bacterium DAT-1]